MLSCQPDREKPCWTAEPRRQPTSAQRSRERRRPCPSAAHRPGLKGNAIAECPSAGLSHPQQPYVVKKRQESLSQCQSDGAGLPLLQMTDHVFEDSQGLLSDVCVVILQSLHDFWQQELRYPHLYRKTPLLLVKKMATLAKMLWLQSTIILLASWQLPWESHQQPSVRQWP